MCWCCEQLPAAVRTTRVAGSCWHAEHRKRTQHNETMRQELSIGPQQAKVLNADEQRSLHEKYADDHLQLQVQFWQLL